MNILRQVLTLTMLMLRGIPERIASAVVIAVGTAVVVGVLLTVLAMSEALTRTITNTASEQRVIVLRLGADSEGGSYLPRDAVLTIADAPGVRRTPEGTKFASPEVLSVVTLKKKDQKSVAEVSIRGVTPMGFRMRPEFKIIAGRTIRPGHQEIVVGRAAQEQFAGLDLDDRVSIRGAQWTIVGVFSSGDNARESELQADADTLLSVLKADVFQSVTLELESRASAQVVRSALKSNPAISVDVWAETDYYRSQSRQLGTLLWIVANVVGGVMAVGASFGALNTMYSAVDARLKEIGTLRAIGYSPFSVAASVLTESYLFALLGAILGAVIARILFDSHSLATVYGGGQVVTKLQINSELFFTGIAWACVMAFVGGLFPAIRAARVSIVTALRDA